MPIAAIGLMACRSPTQIDVVVTTNVACAQVSGTSVTTGTLGEIESIPPTSTTSACASERIGSVVIVPSGEDDALVGFKVVTAINGTSVDQCVPDGTGSYGANCIVARRALRYLPHTPLQVNVLMSGACAGKACDPQSTCVEGACVPATIGDPSQCEGDGCTEQVLIPDGGLPDATVSSEAGEADATLSDATSSDGAEDGAAESSPDAPLDSAPADAAPVTPAAGCDLGGALANSPWPMGGYCPSHRSQSPLVGPASAPTKPPWARWFAQHILGAPAIGPDGTLYVGGGTTGSVHALDPITGNDIWTYAPDGGGAIQGTPVLASDGTARALTLDGTYVMLDLDGGKLLLVAPLETTSQTVFNPPGSATIVTGGTMYVSDNSGNVFPFNASGVVTWVASSASSDFSYPSVEANGTIVTGNGNVHGTNPDGGAAWTYTIGSLEHLPVVSIAVDGSLRVYDQYGGRLYALEGDGGLRWDRNVATGTSATQLAVSADGITYFITGSTLAALDADGNDAGVYPQSCMQPVIDANGDLFTLCEGALVKLDAHLTGAAWSVPTPVGEYQFMNDSPVIGLNGALYFTVDSEDNPDGGPPDLVMGYVQ